MRNLLSFNILGLLFRRYKRTTRRGKALVKVFIDKRQKFIIAVIVLAISLFLAEFQFSKFGIYISVLLAIFTDLFLLWAVFQDVRQNRSYHIFILPFFYSLAFGLFYPIPNSEIFVTRIVLIAFYAFGLYSLFLSQNIFIVSSVRTIQLLSGARIVSFVITLFSYFLLTNFIFTLHFTIFSVIVMMLLYTFPLIYHSLWSYTLAKVAQPLSFWASALTVVLVELATVLWFWPSSPTVLALFLTGFFYIMSGLSHIWFEKRLFKGVLWEYVWVGFVVFLVLILFTQWGK